MAGAARPRFPEGDNTGRNITQDNQTLVGAATLSLEVKQQVTRAVVTAVPATMTVNLATQDPLEDSLLGDEITLVFTASAGSTITMGTGFVASGTIVLTGTNSGSWTGLFDGSAFVETGLVAEAS